MKSSSNYENMTFNEFNVVFSIIIHHLIHNPRDDTPLSRAQFHCGPWPPLSTGSVGVVQKFGEYQGVQEPGCSCDLDFGREAMKIKIGQG